MFGGWGCSPRHNSVRLRLKCDGTRAETRFRLSAKRTSPFKSAGASVQSTTGSRVVRISGSNAGYTMFRGSVQSTGYPLHSQVSPSFPLPCVTVCHHISTGFYYCLCQNVVEQKVQCPRPRGLQNGLHESMLGSQESCAVSQSERKQIIETVN
jgi:hypothetical protein